MRRRSVNQSSYVASIVSRRADEPDPLGHLVKPGIDPQILPKALILPGKLELDRTE